MRRVQLLAIAGILAIGAAGAGGDASGATITLSSHSGTPTLDAELLDATLDFQVTAPAELTLTLSNDTAAPNEFTISAVYFNVTSDVTGLTLASGPRNWSLKTTADNGNPTKAGSFGSFDYALVGKNANRNGIEAADGVIDFVFSITGTGAFQDWYFTTELSEIGAGDQLAFAAAKFGQGPDGSGGFGAFHTPEPSTALLLVCGLMALALLQRNGVAVAQVRRRRDRGR